MILFTYKNIHKNKNTDMEISVFKIIKYCSIKAGK